jgi:hypothetical protein
MQGCTFSGRSGFAGLSFRYLSPNRSSFHAKKALPEERICSNSCYDTFPF